MNEDPGATSRAVKVLADLNTFSRLAIGLPLRPYQVEPARAVLQSILRRQGLASWLATTLGPRRVTGFDFAGRAKKARLGSAFLSLIETGRFKYWAYDPHAGESQGTESVPMTDGWWFWRQAEACAYEVPPDGRFDLDLRWGVPPTHRTDVPVGRLQPTHDDRLLSAVLIAELDRLLRAGDLLLGAARSEIIPAPDPLDHLQF